MPLTTLNFTSSESLSSPNLVTFTDTSIGSDLTLTTRRIYILQADGTYLVPSGTSTDYITWPYSDSSIQLDLLGRSTTGRVTVNWYDNVNNAPLYTKTILMEWDLYDYLFLFSLLSAQTSFPAINSNQGYWPNSWILCTNLFQSEVAVEDMDDLYSSQGALDRNQLFINNQNLYF